MYDFLTGELVEHGPDEVVVQVAGIGYRLPVSGATSGRLPSPGNEVTLFTHHIVRDERMLLYGFGSRQERALFERLLGVSKVGPAIALALLSALDPPRLVAAIDGGDTGLLAKVKGVGKRTAERLCVELKDRLEAVSVVLPGLVTDRTSSVAAALVALGFQKAAAREAAVRVAAEAAPDTPLEELVKLGLALVGRAQGG